MIKTSVWKLQYYGIVGQSALTLVLVCFSQIESETGVDCKCGSAVVSVLYCIAVA